MSTLQESVTANFETKFDDVSLRPRSRKFIWYPADAYSSVKAITDFHIIPAGSTDLSLTVAIHNNSIMVVFIDPDNTGDLSVKINGDTVGNKVASRRVVSDNILTVTASNASATQVRILKQYTIIPQGTINQINSTAAVGSSIHFVYNESVSGTKNGTNKTFTLSNLPYANSLQLYLNGILQKPGVSQDYTISSKTITMTNAPASDDSLEATYSYL